MTESNESPHLAPYASFLSLINLLDWLKEIGVPAQLDRSLWGTKFSGSVGSHLMIALRYLNLLEDETPLPQLEVLVNAEEGERKVILGEQLRLAYPSVFSIDLQRATPKMLDEAFADIGGGVQTRRKAISFFINACKFADIPLSSTLKKKARNRRSATGAKPRKETNSRSTGSAADESAEVSIEQTDSKPTNQSLRTLQLTSGGSLTLTLDVNVFDLSKQDREFVMELVDKVQEYQAESEKTDDYNDDLT